VAFENDSSLVHKEDVVQQRERKTVQWVSNRGGLVGTRRVPIVMKKKTKKVGGNSRCEKKKKEKGA